MDTRCKTYWVVPFLDDVAAFLSQNGMPESSSIVADAAVRVQLCSQLEAGLQDPDSPNDDDSPGGNIVQFGAGLRKH